VFFTNTPPDILQGIAAPAIASSGIEQLGGWLYANYVRYENSLAEK